MNFIDSLARGVGASLRPRAKWVCLRCQQRAFSSSGFRSKLLEIENRTYKTDDWTNVSPTILSALPRRLHLQAAHPLRTTRELIESCFPGYKTHNTFSPVVSVAQNFDALGFPADHPGRARSDTYYVNADTLLRTHTSAHQVDVFGADESDGWLVSADVYRRDAVDRSHYPVFHQMEGAYTWHRRKGRATGARSLAEVIEREARALPLTDVEVQDDNPTTVPGRNPRQEGHHTVAEVEAVAAHLKRSLEIVVAEIFRRARQAAIPTSTVGTSEGGGSKFRGDSEEKLQVRWVEAYFPFTSPSWELEVFWQGDWLEILGCGVVKQEVLIQSGVPDRIGWAFGLGLERIAMLLFGVPDIRLFWSRDSRFLDQFRRPSEASAPAAQEGAGTGASASRETSTTWHSREKEKAVSYEPLIARFVPFSKHPACFKDVSFWLRSTSSAAGGRAGSATAADFHDNDFMELVREEAGDLVEDVRLTDEFTHPRTGRRSKCFRINYRSLERTLTNEEANDLHERIRQRLVEGMGVELR